MGFGDLAREALVAARDAFERVVHLEAKLSGTAEAVERFERRIEARLESRNSELLDEIRELQRRMRDLEVENASLRGKVDGAMAEAMRVVFLERARGMTSSAPDAAPVLSGIEALTAGNKTGT